ncbi:hypothetical protein KY289_028643 [Solanum tuberosum]|nr:hypothetical protein KY289_028643 [Solanum tuberosum]
MFLTILVILKTKVSVTPHLSLGGEVFWAGQHQKSGIGYAARYNTDKMNIWNMRLLMGVSAEADRCVGVEGAPAPGNLIHTDIGDIIVAFSSLLEAFASNLNRPGLFYFLVSLASDFMYNYMSRDVTTSVGYDYIPRQCRLRGKIDSNDCVAAFLEERLNMGLNFILSAEWENRGGSQFKQG